MQLAYLIWIVLVHLGCIYLMSALFDPILAVFLCCLCVTKMPRQLMVIDLPNGFERSIVQTQAAKLLGLAAISASFGISQTAGIYLTLGFCCIPLLLHVSDIRRTTTA